MGDTSVWNSTGWGAVARQSSYSADVPVAAKQRNKAWMVEARGERLVQHNAVWVLSEDEPDFCPVLFILPPSSFPLQRLIWLAGADEIADERQRAFVQRVQEDPALHQCAEIIEGNLNLLKKDLIRRLSPPEPKPKAAAPAKAAAGAPKLYLICDPKDESQVEALEDYLFNQGLEVSLPAFDGADADAAALHQENLRVCDAVLVYYAAAPKAWVDIKLRELLKAAGYGREKPIAVQAVCIAPLHDHRKERYRSLQAAVIRQPDEFAPSSELDAFIGQVKEACV